MYAGRTFKTQRDSAPVNGSVNGWMVTFADLLTLLLTLFVVRYSMSTIEFKPALSGERTPPPPSADVQLGVPTDRPSGIELKSRLETQLVTKLAERMGKALGSPEVEHGLGGYRFKSGIELKRAGTSVVVIFDGTTFTRSSDELTFTGQTNLKTFLDALSGMTPILKIAGHTDALPINSKIFPSNWELSLGRSLAIRRQMIDAGVEGQSISVIGFGSSKPAVPQNSPLATLRNNRIEVELIPVSSLK